VVAVSGVVDVGWGHLGPVDAPRYAAGFKVGGDGSSMDPELFGEVGEWLPSSIGGDEPVDLGLVEAALNGTPNRILGRLRLPNIGRLRAVVAGPGCRV